MEVNMNGYYPDEKDKNEIVARKERRSQEKDENSNFWKKMEKIGLIITSAAAVVTIIAFFVNSSTDRSNVGGDIIDPDIENHGDNNKNNNITGDGNTIEENHSGVIVNNYPSPSSSETPGDAGFSTAKDEKPAPVYNVNLEMELANSADYIQAAAFEEAEIVLSSMLEECPDHQTKAVILYNQGVCNYQNGAYGHAIVDFKESINNSPSSAAYFGLGLAYTAAGDEQDVDKAIAAYSAAIELEPNLDYYLARAYTYQESGRYDLAESDYQSVLQEDEQNIYALQGVKTLKTLR